VLLAAGALVVVAGAVLALLLLRSDDFVGTWRVVKIDPPDHFWAQSRREFSGTLVIQKRDYRNAMDTAREAMRDESENYEDLEEGDYLVEAGRGRLGRRYVVSREGDRLIHDTPMEGGKMIFTRDGAQLKLRWEIAGNRILDVWYDRVPPVEAKPK
jgi:hypothetical protein